MLSRVVAALVVGAGLAVAAPSAPAFAQSSPDIHADPSYEATLDFLRGGAPAGRGGVYAASPVPRQTVRFESNHRPGTIVIRSGERRLYLVQEGGRALRYGIGVGRPGFSWRGSHRITAKREWPDWRPPAQMLRRQPNLPRHMPGGPNNPLGARAMYLGSTLYRIHGSNEPHTIGQAVSSGCIRMTNDDVVHLYNQVKVGTMVVVQ